MLEVLRLIASRGDTGLKTQSIALLIATLSLGWSHPSWSSFHLWDISEVYSNADGSVQFIELFSASDGQGVLIGRTLVATSDGTLVAFMIPSDVSSSTSGKNLLFASAAFPSAPGGIAADFILPDNFFDPDAMNISIDFAGVDILNFSSTDIPTDGVLSIDASLKAGINNPVNFAGEMGELTLELLIFENGFEN